MIIYKGSGGVYKGSGGVYKGSGGLYKGSGVVQKIIMVYMLKPGHLLWGYWIPFAFTVCL